MKTVVKIGSAELSEQDVEKIHEDRKYICTYGGIYQVFRSPASGQYYGHKVINCKGDASRGRYYAHSAEQINHVLGKPILNESEEK